MDNPVIDKHGHKRWYDTTGKIHRTDGPAIEWADGTKDWWQHGLRHRADGPAVEYAHGTKDWWQHGLRHRADGPAVEWADGDKFWYLNDKLLSFDQWLDEVDISAEDKVMMKLKYG
tara:strand:- start:287 stop:634 length:348 start_codon:yes stop_codon:yes gene_type:complete